MDTDLNFETGDVSKVLQKIAVGCQEMSSSYHDLAATLQSEHQFILKVFRKISKIKQAKHTIEEEEIERET